MGTSVGRFAASLGVGLAVLVVGPAVPSADSSVEVSSGQGLPIAGLETAGARSGRQLVVWEQTAGGVNDPRQVWGRAIGADGDPVGSAFRVSRATVDGTPVEAGAPAVAARGRRDEFLVVWGQRIGESNGNLVGRRFAADGTPISDEFPLTRASQFAAAGGPAIAYGARRREFVIAWSALPPRVGSGPTETAPEVYAARLRDGRAGTPASRRISLMGGDTSDKYGGAGPAVAYNAQRGSYLVAWDGEHPQNDGHAPFARTLSGDPRGRLGPVRRLSAPDSFEGVDPDVAFNPAAREYAVTWTVERFRPDARVYARRVRPSGRPRGDEVKVAPDGSFGDAGSADIEARAARGYQVVYDFSDAEFGDREVFAGRLGSSLRLRRAHRIAGGEQGGGSAGQPDLAVVSPDRDFRVVWFERIADQSSHVFLSEL